MGAAATVHSNRSAATGLSVTTPVTQLITREDLKEKLDRGDDFRLVMALGDWYFRAAHIPGSLSVCSPTEADEILDPHDEIVVYCTNVACPASKFLCVYLEGAGYKRIRRYADGISGWLEAGYPLDVSKLSRGYCQLVAAGAAFGRWEIEIAQAAVAALHSLKERSRNSR